MNYQHPDGRVLFVDDMLSKGTEWGVFWKSSTGGNHRVKSIPMSVSKEVALQKLEEFALKNKCKPIGEVTEESKKVENIIIEYNPASSELEDKLSTIRDKVREIGEKVKEIGLDFIVIGNAFIDIDTRRLYQEKGYKNIVEMAAQELKISKTTLYNLMSVAQKFSADGKLLEGYENYNFSQLVEMVSLPDGLLDKVSPEMSVKEIQQAKKEEKLQVNGSTEEQNNNSNMQKQTVDNVMTEKHGTHECPDSGITSRIPFPNIMCRQCKNHQDCSKYKEKQDDIEKQANDNIGIRLDGGSLDNNDLQDIKEELSENIKKNNEKIRATAAELINNLQDCSTEKGFRLESETDQLLTRISQYRLSIIERQLNKK